jgi:hypothetical protein
VDGRGRHLAPPAPEALHGLHHRHIAALVHEELGRRHGAPLTGWALRLDEALGPIREVVREAEFGRVHWLIAGNGRPLQDDVVGPLDCAHDLLGEMGCCDPVGRVHRPPAYAFDPHLNDPGEFRIIGRLKVRGGEPSCLVPDTDEGRIGNRLPADRGGASYSI